MCGIIGCRSESNCTEFLLDGLDRLDYRGYDSAGLALQNGHSVRVTKLSGEVSNLREAVERSRPTGAVGLGHTRWSTHGPPTDENAHPHTDCSGRVAVVHNGIIDNHGELREDLESRGHEFTSDTDTEVVPHLIEERLQAGESPAEAFRQAADRLSGAYALVALVEGCDELYATRRGSPLVLGLDEDRTFLASDVPAFLPETDRVVYVENGEFVRIGGDGYTIRDGDGELVEREPETVEWDPENTGRGGYEHYMLKEIHEQPTSLRKTVRGRVGGGQRVTLEDFPPGCFTDVRRVYLVGMGTSYHAALYGAMLLDRHGVDASAHLASEFATTEPPLDDRTLVVAVTQSGETADTLSAVRRARAEEARTVALTNVVGSTVTRECDRSFFIRAGPEIGVAATKTFSSQVASLALLSVRLVDDSGTVRTGGRLQWPRAITDLPAHVQTVLDTTNAEQVARQYLDKDAYFFLGRWIGHPVALEGALKFKEISYEHAEGFGGAELKHGPLALVTEETPVFAVFTGAETDALASNVREVQARGAPVVTVAPESIDRAHELGDETLTVPDAHPDIVGVSLNVQLQLVAYHVASRLGRSIDKPRNLAKSVTVE